MAGNDFRIHQADSLELGQLALDGFLSPEGSLLIDRDTGWVCGDGQGQPVGVLIARPALFFHTLILPRPDWITARRLLERAQGFMDAQPGRLRTSLFQVAPGNATMERLAARLGGVADPGQLWRVD